MLRLLFLPIIFCLSQKNCAQSFSDLGKSHSTSHIKDSVWIKTTRPSAKLNVLEDNLGELPGEVISKMIDSSIVTIISTKYQVTGHGSGVIVSSNGYILTNYHVVKDFSQIYIRHRFFKEELLATIIFFDIPRDIAVIKVDKKLNPIQLGSSNKAKKGETVYAMGSPIFYENVITKGIISLKIDLQGKLFILHDASIGSGNSGGALVNSRGELIGINVASEKSTGDLIIQNLNYTIPIGDIERLLRENNLQHILEKPEKKRLTVPSV